MAPNFIRTCAAAAKTVHPSTKKIGLGAPEDLA